MHQAKWWKVGGIPLAWIARFHDVRSCNWSMILENGYRLNASRKRGAYSIDTRLQLSV